MHLIIGMKILKRIERSYEGKNIKVRIMFNMNFEYLKQELNKLLKDRATPGVDCRVYKDHTEIFRYYAGFNDVDNSVKLNGDELYLIFSLTKLLTCVSALQLFEKGAFKMDDQLSKYIEDFSNMYIETDIIAPDDSTKVETTGDISVLNKKNKKLVKAKTPITIKHLFTMTAGFGYNMKDEPVMEAIAKGNTTTGDLVKAFSKLSLCFEPGTRFKYSLCHDIIGSLVEIWSGMTLGEYMKKNIFEPLGMKDTFFGVPKDSKRLSRLSCLYRSNEVSDYVKIPQECIFNLTDEFESGGAGIVSTTNDYALFLDALACGGVGKSGKRILSEATVELMKTNQLNGKALEDFELIKKGYGYGFGVRTHIAPNRSGSFSPVGEFGWDGAAGSYALVDTESHISLTYFQHMLGWNPSLEKYLRNTLYKCIKDV